MPIKRPIRKTPEQKIDLFVEKVAQGKPGAQAVRESGWEQNPDSSAVTASRLLRNAKVRARVEARKAEIMKAARFHTDVLIGSLVEIANADMDDVLDSKGNFSIKKARKNGVTRLIKKIEPLKDGGVKVEMYSRTEAIAQLRDTFGMKQEPRANQATEVESAIQDFIQKAREKGYEIDYEQAREYIEPRMISDATM